MQRSSRSSEPRLTSSASRSGSRLQSGAIVAWTAVVTALTLQNDFYGVSSWLDGSWQVALDLAHRLHLPLGARPVFTYGPYGFLDVRTPFFTREWLEGAAFAVAVHVVFISLIALLLWRRRSGLGTWIAVGLTLLVAVPIIPYANLEGSLLVAILAYLALDATDPRGRAIAAVGAGALLAVLVLDKVTAVVIVGGTLVVTLGALLVVRRWRGAAALLVGFSAVLAALWAAAGLTLGDVASFARSAWELGSGYSAAMYFGSPSPELYGAAVLLLAALGLAIAFVVRRDAGRTLWFLLVLVAGFAAFKDDFVRTGTDRYMLFYSSAAILAVLSLVVAARGSKCRRSLLAVSAPALFVAMGLAVLLTSYGAHVYSLNDLPTRWASYRASFSVLLNSEQRHSVQNSLLLRAQNHYANWINNLHVSSYATVDVMPWDDAMFYANQSLHWDPRPVLQSYTAYTQWLDNADAAYLSGRSAPDYIVYSVQSIDDRAAVFDEPATFRALLQHYYVVRPLDGVTVLLRRLPEGRPGTSTTVSRTCVPFGTQIAVPQLSDRWVFADVDVEPTLLGRGLTLLYEPSGVNVSVTLPRGPQEHRMVTAVASDGLFVSAAIRNEFDLVPVFLGSRRTPILSLTVTTVSTAGWKSPVCVTFTSVPAPQQLTSG